MSFWWISLCFQFYLQNRSLQVDGNDRTHSESRLKSELNAADHRVQNLEAENSSLRRHLLDVTEGKGEDDGNEIVKCVKWC